jgi:hypothetical protein
LLREGHGHRETALQAASLSGSLLLLLLLLAFFHFSFFLPAVFRCCDQGQYEQAVGVALEARRLDKLEEVVARAPDCVKALKYSLRICQGLVINREFRQQVGAALT